MYMNEKLLTKLLELAVQDGTKTSEETPFEVGKSYFIRTVGYFFVGTVDEIKGKFLILKNCSCVFDTGRYSDAIKDGKLEELSASEIEPLPDETGVAIESITDFSPWLFKLPQKQK